MPVWQQLRHPLTIVLPNLIDAGKFALGTIQATWRLLLWRPDAIFAKGGFVCLPIGLAARFLRIPLVIHDSDAHPGLTNRILARSAKLIATGAPLEYYPYPLVKSRYVGIPVDSALRPVSADEQAAKKTILGFVNDRPLVLVTGGGLGAVRINNAVVQALPELLKHSSIALVCGKSQYDELRAQVGEDTASFQLHAFISNNMHEYMAAADVVIARAGMTTILELAALAKPTILIPNALLTGGHQLKNAAVYADAEAVEIIEEASMNTELTARVSKLLANSTRQQQLGAALHMFARPNAAAEVAEMVISAQNATIKKTK